MNKTIINLPDGGQVEVKWEYRDLIDTYHIIDWEMLDSNMKLSAHSVYEMLLDELQSRSEAASETTWER